MADAYSNFGLISDLYASNLTCGGERRRWRLRKPSVLFDAEMMFVIWARYDKLEQRVTPRYLYDSTNSIHDLEREY